VARSAQGALNEFLLALEIAVFLAKLDIWPDGSAIELEQRDIHISVDGLLMAVLPALLPDSALAAIFASRGGKATSDSKRASAQANGRKGGRPRKGVAAA
jgi:hypothetical protein